jgi:hypothetical protein
MAKDKILTFINNIKIKINTYKGNVYRKITQEENSKHYVEERLTPQPPTRLQEKGKQINRASPRVLSATRSIYLSISKAPHMSFLQEKNIL